MSKGNTKTNGQKGSNMPYQLSDLLISADIKNAVQALVAAIPPGALATEATAISILNAIVASDQDIEILLVRDEAVGNGDPVLKQVTNYQTGVPVITYENVDGTPYVPAPNPVPVYVYLDPSAVLNLMLAQLVLLNAGGQLLTEATFVAEDFATESTLGVVNTNLSTINTNVQLGNVVLGNLLTAFNAEDFATETTLAALNALLVTIDGVLDAVKLDTAAMVVDLAALEVLQTATNALLTAIDLDTSAIAVSTAAIDTKLTGASRTAAVSVAVIDGATAAGAQSVSFYFRGTGGTLDGAAMPSGIVITFTPLKGEDTVGAINYVVPTAGASQIIITTLT